MKDKIKIKKKTKGKKKYLIKIPQSLRGLLPGKYIARIVSIKILENQQVMGGFEDVAVITFETEDGEIVEKSVVLWYKSPTALLLQLLRAILEDGEEDNDDLNIYDFVGRELVIVVDKNPKTSLTEITGFLPLDDFDENDENEEEYDEDEENDEEDDDFEEEDDGDDGDDE